MLVRLVIFVAHATGQKFVLSRLRGLTWQSGEGTHWFSAVFPAHTNDLVSMREQIDATGYTVEDVISIERAFESSYRSVFGVCNMNEEKYKDEHIFKGLMAVVEVLADIHQISLEARETAKQLFVKV